MSWPASIMTILLFFLLSLESLPTLWKHLKFHLNTNSQTSQFDIAFRTTGQHSLVSKDTKIIVSHLYRHSLWGSQHPNWKS